MNATTTRPAHVARALAILATPCRTRVDTPDGPLIVSLRIDLEETPAAMLALAAGDVEGFRDALGPAREAMLTSDGRPRGNSFCQCADAPAASTWFRYERYSARGREAHGYGCTKCRGITQTG